MFSYVLWIKWRVICSRGSPTAQMKATNPLDNDVLLTWLTQWYLKALEHGNYVRISATWDDLLPARAADEYQNLYTTEVRARYSQRGLWGGTWADIRSQALHIRLRILAPRHRVPACSSAHLRLMIRAFTLVCALVPRACMGVEITPLSENVINNLCVKNNFLFFL